MDHAYYQRRLIQHAEASVTLGIAQSLTLNGIDQSMAHMMAELSDLRQTHAATLALQQAILQRDVLQERLEEFIYLSRKMLSSFDDSGDLTPPVEKALLLRSFFLAVKNSGISTAQIRGISNKEMFDNCLDQAQSLYRHLNNLPDVQHAIAFEEAFDKRRLEDEAREQAKRVEQAKLSVSSRVIVFRSVSATGGMYRIRVSVDGNHVGDVANGERLLLDLAPGEHVVSVSGGGLRSALNVAISPDERLKLNTYFSMWGILGGGLNLRQV